MGKNKRFPAENVVFAWNNSDLLKLTERRKQGEKLIVVNGTPYDHFVAEIFQEAIKIGFPSRDEWELFKMFFFGGAMGLRFSDYVPDKSPMVDYVNVDPHKMIDRIFDTGQRFSEQAMKVLFYEKIPTMVLTYNDSQVYAKARIDFGKLFEERLKQIGVMNKEVTFGRLFGNNAGRVIELAKKAEYIRVDEDKNITYLLGASRYQIAALWKFCCDEKLLAMTKLGRGEMAKGRTGCQAIAKEFGVSFGKNHFSEIYQLDQFGALQGKQEAESEQKRLKRIFEREKI